ncbi:MAG TPA: hypothetical protein VMF69_26185 [Gemmataceae bacterium]|nr:hypothetical protein [Gemmataceae bacterium]
MCLTLAEDRKTPQPPPQKQVDFRNPPREYKTVRLDKWTVFVEKQLVSESPAVARLAQARIKVMLAKALAALPEPSRANIKQLPIYLMYGPKARGGGRDNGLEYFQKDAPKHHKHLDLQWKSCMVIYCADNYVHISDFWALKALVHEFAHAYHLEQWPEKQPDILRAWDHAVEQGLYRNVMDDSGKRIDKAYALVNQLEYFAELSCMYFVGCQYQPFTRKELKAYDPVGYAMMQKMWHVK